VSEAPLGVANRDRLLDEARVALRELAIQLRDLQEAMKLFGDDFDRGEFESAFARRRGESAAAAQVNQVNWPLVTLVNQVNTILRNGAVLSGFRRLDAPDRAPEVYAALRDNEIIDWQRAADLTQLNRTRNSLTHRYGTFAEGRDVYEATLLAREIMTSFGRDFGAWLREMGVLPRAEA
jgi:hypothetical protein